MLVLRILFIAFAGRVTARCQPDARRALSLFVMQCTIGDVPDQWQVKIVMRLSDKIMKENVFCHEILHKRGFGIFKVSFP